MKKKSVLIALGSLLTIIIAVSTIVGIKKEENSIATNSNIKSELSNEKIGWGIKKEDNHKQPDFGAKNKALIEKYNGIAIGKSDSKNVYLTFDNGYEAGYTDKILDVLKENNVTATFFITAHYVNTQPELVKRMIDEGHIVGNHSSYLLMDMLKREKNSRFA